MGQSWEFELVTSFSYIANLTLIFQNDVAETFKQAHSQILFMMPPNDMVAQLGSQAPAHGRSKIFTKGNLDEMSYFRAGNY